MKLGAYAAIAAVLLATGATPGVAAGNCADQLRRFTTAWNGASPAHRTTTASRHYAAALAAQKTKNERESVAQLRMATDTMK